MRISKVTSVEVAKVAGVSQSAVSRVYTPGASVSSAVVAKVKKAAAKLGYRPNAMARSLITGKSKIVGLIVSYLDNQFYPESIKKLSEALQENGYHLLVFTIENKPSIVARSLQEMLDYQVDAIIVASISLTSDLSHYCHEIGVPLVLYNRWQDNDKVSYVVSDNIAGGRSVAKHFAELGIKRPAYISGWRYASTQRDREIGYRQGLEQYGLTLFARGNGRFRFEQAKIATRQMFTSSKIPDAVFVANDHMAFAVMDVIRYELGLAIPDDVVVAGYDDVVIASWSSYLLTSVQQAVNSMIKATVDIIISAIDGDVIEPKHIVLKGKLIKRNSSDKK